MPGHRFASRDPSEFPIVRFGYVTNKYGLSKAWKDVVLRTWHVKSRKNAASTCKIHSPRRDRTCRHFLFSFHIHIIFTCASSPSFSLYCYLIATILFWIWQTRNLATFRNSVLNVNQIVNLIKKDMSCRILCAKQDEKQNFWSTGNILCKISDAHSISFFPYCS